MGGLWGETQDRAVDVPRLPPCFGSLSAVSRAQSRLGLPGRDSRDRRIRRTCGDAHSSAISPRRRREIPWAMPPRSGAFSSSPPPGLPFREILRLLWRSSVTGRCWIGIISELSSKTAYEAVRKLEFIGGKPAVDALIHSLDLPEEVGKNARNLEIASESFMPIWNPGPYGKPGEIEREPSPFRIPRTRIRSASWECWR